MASLSFLEIDLQRLCSIPVISPLRLSTETHEGVGVRELSEAIESKESAPSDISSWFVVCKR